VTQRSGPKDNYLVTVILISCVLGMAVAVGVYFGWKNGAIAPGFHSAISAIALLVCPPFVLSFAIGPAPDSDLALILIVGTIVFANAFLYAGVAAGGYFLVSMMAHKRTRR
jgi:hypothetical protein